MTALFDNSRMTRHRHTNRASVIGLLAAIALVLMLCADLIAGTTGIIVAVALIVAGMMSARRAASVVVLQLFKAAPVGPYDWPDVYNSVNNLAQRAGLSTMPQIYRLPGDRMMAFSTGAQDTPVIALSTGALQHLDSRELRGIIAHELAHISSGDMTLLMLAEVMARLTRLIATFGFFLALWFTLAGKAEVPLAALIVLLIAPTGVSLLQLALSRNREFDADATAVDLTGDAQGLASALGKLESEQASILRRLFWPYTPGDVPTLFRTHPKTEERIERLLNPPPD